MEWGWLDYIRQTAYIGNPPITLRALQSTLTGPWQKNTQRTPVENSSGSQLCLTWVEDIGDEKVTRVTDQWKAYVFPSARQSINKAKETLVHRKSTQWHRWLLTLKIFGTANSIRISGRTFNTNSMWWRLTLTVKHVVNWNFTTVWTSLLLRNW